MRESSSFGDFQQNQVIGDFFLRERVISAADLNRAIEHQSIINARLDTAILDLGLVRERQLLEGLGRLYRCPTVSGNDLEFIHTGVSRLIAPRMAARYKIVPFKVDGKTISIASMSRTDILLEDELRMLTGCVITTYVTLEVYLTEALAFHYGVERTLVMRMLSQRLRDTGRIDRRQNPPPQPSTTQTPASPRSQPARPVAPVNLKPSLPIPEVAEMVLTGEDYDLFSLSYDDSVVAPTPTALEYFPPIPTNQSEAAPAISRVAPAEPSSEHERPELRLAHTADLLKNAEMREDIGDAILDYCEPLFRRRMLLVRRGETIMGWRGDGDGVDELAIRAISIPIAEPSVFVGLGETINFWLGPLPPLTRNIDLVFGLGSDQPKECIILPITVKTKVIGYLYGDNMSHTVAGAPLSDLRRLVVKAGIAFQVYILKNKIHIA